MEGISRRALAARTGISKSAVRRHIASGALAGAVLSDGSLDAARATEALSGTITQGKVVPIALTTARTRRLRAQVAKLTDEVADLLCTSVLPTDAQAQIAEQFAVLARHIRKVPDAASQLAGQTAAAVLPVLRGHIYDAMEANVAEEVEGAWWNEGLDKPLVDVATLTPNALLAKKIDLSAAKMELLHSRERGELRDMESIRDEFEEKAAVLKSALFALPARLAQAFEASTPEETRTIVATEIESALAALAE